jgi:hypothetical protein
MVVSQEEEACLEEAKEQHRLTKQDFFSSQIELQLSPCTLTLCLSLALANIDMMSREQRIVVLISGSG